MNSLFSLLCVLCLSAAPLHAAAVPAKAGPAAAGAGTTETTASYQYNITWQPDLRVHQAEGVFPSWHDPQRVWVATPDGLLETGDDAQTWRLIPNTGRAQLGRITSVLYGPLSLKLILLASRDKGVFRSDDGGRTWKNTGTPASGLKSAQVERLAWDPTDWSMRTVLATHGADTAGISKSLDGGLTWATVGERWFAQDLMVTGGEILISGAKYDTPDVRGIYRSTDGGIVFSEWRHDCGGAVLGESVMPAYQLAAPLQGRLLRRGVQKRVDDWEEAGPPGEGHWRAVFTGWGNDWRVERLFAYDSQRFGLLVSADGFKTWNEENNGLFISHLIKEGANLCANASTQTFYASINGQLYVGRACPGSGPPLAEIRLDPPLLRWTKDASIRITVQGAPGPAKHKLKSVEADFSSLSLPPLNLLDYGKQDDDQANAGLFGGTLILRRPWVRPDKQVRCPGRTTIRIVATDVSGAQTAVQMPLSIYPPLEDMVLWHGDKPRQARAFYFSTGCHIAEYATGGRVDPHCLHLTSTAAGWSCGWGTEGSQNYYALHNVSEQAALSFWIKLAQEAAPRRDIKVALYDDGSSNSSFSSEVWLLQDGYVKTLSTQWQEVRIPLDKFRKLGGFHMGQCCGVAFGGKEDGHDFFVDDIVFEAPK